MDGLGLQRLSRSWYGLFMETTSFDLTTEQKDLLQSLSQETGKPISTLIAEALEGLQAQMRPGSVNGKPTSDMDEDAAPGAPPAKHIWDIADELLEDVPEEELNRLPKDGAAQVDHYVYGLPKR